MISSGKSYAKFVSLVIKVIGILVTLINLINRMDHIFHKLDLFSPIHCISGWHCSHLFIVSQGGIVLTCSLYLRVASFSSGSLGISVRLLKLAPTVFSSKGTKMSEGSPILSRKSKCSTHPDVIRDWQNKKGTIASYSELIIYQYTRVKVIS